MKAFFKKRETPFVYSRFYLYAKKWWAEKMARLTEGRSRKQLIFLLVLFTVLASGYFLYTIYKSFTVVEAFSVKDVERSSTIKMH